MMDDMEAMSEIRGFQKLISRIRQLITLIDELSAENQKLREQLSQKTEGEFDENKQNKIVELEEEITSLRRENKQLKEKESLIKNKVERLAVKLENVR